MKSSSKPPHRLVKFWCLNWTQKWLLLKALVVLAAYKVLLLIIPFSRFIAPTSASIPQKKALCDSYITEQLWAVRVISAQIPLGFTCLVQALGTKWLLKNHPDIQVCVGVRNSKTEGFSAHAWVTHQHKIILGEQTSQVFEPILAWN